MNDNTILRSEEYAALLQNKLNIHNDKLKNLAPGTLEWDWRVGLVLNISQRIDSVIEGSRSLL